MQYPELIKNNLHTKFDFPDQIIDDKWVFNRMATHREKETRKLDESVLISIRQLIMEIKNNYQNGDELWSFGISLNVPFNEEYGYALIRNSDVVWYKTIVRS